MKTIYGLKNSDTGFFFGIKPYDLKHKKDYDNLKKVISLKEDMNWRELKHLQDILKKADIWENFPIDGITILDAEFKIAEQNQRVDILFLKNDGNILPCELKIAGDSKDTHGQLIRYISDLCSIKLDLSFVQKKNKNFVNNVLDAATKEEHIKKFDDFISSNKIVSISALPNTGIIIDTNFKPQLVKAVNHLNTKCNFNIKLIKITTKVDDSWTYLDNDYFFRLDFEQIN